MPLHIIDTAGLRESTDTVEQIGIQRAWLEIEQADRLLLLIDSVNTPSIETAVDQFIEENKSKALDKSLITIVANKIDQSDLSPQSSYIQDIPIIYLSAKTNNGVELLVEHLKQVMGYSNTLEGGFTARRRHIDALVRAEESLQHGIVQLHQGAGELLAEDLRVCQQHLGEITGNVSADDLLGKIFSSFCIGK